MRAEMRGLTRVYRVYTQIARQKSIDNPGNRVVFRNAVSERRHRARRNIARAEICVRTSVANEPRNTRASDSANSSIRNEIVFN